MIHWNHRMQECIKCNFPYSPLQNVVSVSSPYFSNWQEFTLFYCMNFISHIRFFSTISNLTLTIQVFHLYPYFVLYPNSTLARMWWGVWLLQCGGNTEHSSLPLAVCFSLITPGLCGHQQSNHLIIHLFNKFFFYSFNKFIEHYLWFWMIQNINNTPLSSWSFQSYSEWETMI